MTVLENKPFKNKKGLAMLEALTIIWIMFVLLGATLGSWGVVQTATLNSIASRHYSYFYFNHRSNLSYLRDFAGGPANLTPSVDTAYYSEDRGYRFHYVSGTLDTSANQSSMRATLRRVDFRKLDYSDNRTGFLADEEHSDIQSKVPGGKNEHSKVGPAWIMVGYGICLNASCGDN